MGCLETQAAAVNDKITKQNNNFLFIFVEFDDKYKAMIVLRVALFIFFSTAFLPRLFASQDRAFVEPKDTASPKIFMIKGNDTVCTFQELERLPLWTKEQLRPYWKQGYALARWELQPQINNSPDIRYHFMLDKKITKGKITGWDAEVMDASLAPIVIDWKIGQLFTQPFIPCNLQEYGIQIQEAEVFFEDSIARLKVAIRSVSNQYFDGLIGLQQNNGKSTLVGDLKVNWTNMFKRGESFLLRWQRQDLATQRLELNAEIPFLFRHAFGWANAFDFFRKQDFVFQIALKSQLIFHLSDQQKWSTGIELKNNQSLKIDNPIFTKHQLWVNTYQKENTHVEFAAGRRILQRNVGDSIATNQQQLFRWDVNWERNWKHLGWGGNLRMHSLGYFSKSLDESELIRIGGPNSIRGFNTESLFVQQWNGFQSEFGYQLLNVFGYLFVDGGYRDELAFRQLHHSYGLGAKIDRNGVMLSLAYGWGVFPGQGLDLRQGVFHIGLNQKF